MNNLGMVVGNIPFGTAAQSGFIFDQHGALGTPHGLYLLGAFVPSPEGEGWTRSSCVGINDLGQVVGYFGNSITGEQRGYFVQLPILNAPLSWQSLPSLGSNNFYGRRINNKGDILAWFTTADQQYAYLYNPSDQASPFATPWIVSDPTTGPVALAGNLINLNDHAEVTGAIPIAGVSGDGTAFRLTPGMPLETIPALYRGGIHGINNDGVIVGWASVVIRNKQAIYPCRYSNAIEVIGPQNDNGTDINSAGDVVIEAVYHDDVLLTRGNTTASLSINQLVTGTSQDVADWSSAAAYKALSASSINDRDGTGFGQIAGSATVRIKSTQTVKGKTTTTYTDDPRMYIVTPELP